jgi:hypothetical protein
MSKTTDLYDFFLECPYCQDLLPISADTSRGADVFFPRGSSSIYALQNERLDVLGNYSCTMMPYPSIFEDWQMNCYRETDPNDETQNGNNLNIIAHDEVEKICKWILEKNAKRELPKYSGERVFAIIPTETKPAIWGADALTNEIVYAIIVRVYFVNPEKMIDIEYES